VSNFGNVNLRGESGQYGKFEPPSITVYSMEASGNVKPLRIIEGPKTLMNWPAHLAFHEGRQELFVANDADSSILVFRAGEQGDVAPIRVIKGPKTGIKHPPGLAIDTKLGELYVANMGSPTVTVFPVTAEGDVAPLRTVRAGPATAANLMIGNPGAVGYDTRREQILVPN
jgi:6-phosphogluconolactonase (cycloisomerase 2 family)